MNNSNNELDVNIDNQIEHQGSYLEVISSIVFVVFTVLLMYGLSKYLAH